MEAEVINQLNNTLNDLEKRSEDIRVYMDYQGKKDRLEEVIGLSEDPELWNDPKRAQEIGKERKILEGIVLTLDNIASGIEDNRMLIEMAVEENDEEGFAAVQEDVAGLENKWPTSNSNECSTSLPTRTTALSTSPQARAVPKPKTGRACCSACTAATPSAKASKSKSSKKTTAKSRASTAPPSAWKANTPTACCVPKPAFTAWCATRRLTPTTKRHTSFSSVFVYPEIDDSIEIEINPADLRIDTYRASGAGGQHINKTDSAVRITHEPTGIVVQCQNDRSQHANKAAAMEMLKSKLYELEMRKRNEEKQALEDGKSDVGWGSQIRSYVLDSSRIKDLRTGYEVGNTKAVLDGDLDGFIEASLKQGV